MIVTQEHVAYAAAKVAEMLDEERQAHSHETGHIEADRECMVQEIERLRAELDAAYAQRHASGEEDREHIATK